MPKKASEQIVSRETISADLEKTGFSVQTKDSLPADKTATIEKEKKKQHPEEAIERQQKEEGFRELYDFFRENKLSVFDSLYNALFLTAENRMLHKKEKTQKPTGDLFEHPKGWSNSTGKARKSLLWSLVMKFLLFLPKLVIRTEEAFNKNATSKAAENADNAVKLAEKTGSVIKRYALSAAVLIFTFCVFAHMATLGEVKAALELYVDGERQGYVKSAEVYFAALESAEDNLSDLLGIRYKIPDGTASYKLAAVKKPEYLSDTEITGALINSSKKYLSVGYGLYIDETLVAVGSSRMMMDEILDETLALYNELYSNTKKRDDMISFSNRVIIKEITVPKTVIKNKEEIRSVLGLDDLHKTNELLLRDNSLERITLVDVSLMLPELESISAKELSENLPEGTVSYIDAADNDAALNSDSSTDTTPVLNKGKADEKTVLSFKTTKQKTFNEVLPCDIEYTYDSDVLEGRKIISVPGVNGIKRATYDVYYVGDEEIGRKLISEEIIKKPVTKVIKIGTRPASELDGEKYVTGTFMMPYDGPISSYFSGRTLFGNYEFHGALDIYGPNGSPIVASDGGEVVFAGENGTYGYCVIIDHGDGIETLYAHLRAFAVEKGDIVGQGWKIGEMGRTGRATGYHVHFEVRVDGVKQNPLDYINK